MCINNITFGSAPGSTDNLSAEGIGVMSVLQGTYIKWGLQGSFLKGILIIKLLIFYILVYFCAPVCAFFCTIHVENILMYANSMHCNNWKHDGVWG